MTSPVLNGSRSRAIAATARPMSSGVPQRLIGVSPSSINLSYFVGVINEFIRRKKTKPGKVVLISGGGAGHEPLHAGFVGFGERSCLDERSPFQGFKGFEEVGGEGFWDEVGLEWGDRHGFAVNRQPVQDGLL